MTSGMQIPQPACHVIQGSEISPVTQTPAAYLQNTFCVPRQLAAKHHEDY